MARLEILPKMRFASILFLLSSLSAQLYIPADPFDLLFTEQKIMMGGNDPGSLMIRPIIPPVTQSKNVWSLKVKNEFFYNNGGPNLENTSDRWIGNGISLFTSANITYTNDFIFTSIEPYYFRSQNIIRTEPQRILKFSHLNDNIAHVETPYVSAGFRETQLYLNYKGIGGGFSNANMWWHLMLGTINEKRVKNWGINGRYILSKFGNKSQSKPYYSGFIFNTTYYSIPTITLGFSRSFLSGGENTNYDISLLEAALLPFQFVKIEKPKYQEDILNPVDQTYTGYINFRFPNSGTVLFFEWGRNEGPDNLKDFILAPNHSDAFTIGTRKYGLFNSINLFIAIEYTNIAFSSFWQMRETLNWYDNTLFDYYTYDGRHWAAHSGSDSDDFSVLFGYSNNKISIMQSFNYERHGLTHAYTLLEQKAKTLVYENKKFGNIYLSDDRVIFEDDPYFFAETKLEFKLDIRYFYKDLRFALVYEYQNIINFEFKGIKKKNSVIMFSVEKNF
jgi:hypothetical protein